MHSSVQAEYETKCVITKIFAYDAPAASDFGIIRVGIIYGIKISFDVEFASIVW